jgi:hypothetical protein
MHRGVLLRRPYTAASVAAGFFYGVFRLHGIINVLIFDRDRVVLSLFWKELFDGQSELVSRCLEMYLRCFASHETKVRCPKIERAEYWYYTSYHSSSHPYNASRSKLYMGGDPPTLFGFTRYPPLFRWWILVPGWHLGFITNASSLRLRAQQEWRKVQIWKV